MVPTEIVPESNGFCRDRKEGRFIFLTPIRCEATIRYTQFPPIPPSILPVMSDCRRVCCRIILLQQRATCIFPTGGLR